MFEPDWERWRKGVLLTLLIGVVGTGCGREPVEGDTSVDVADGEPDAGAAPSTDADVGSEAGGGDGGDSIEPIRQSDQAPWLVEIEGEAEARHRPRGGHRWETIREDEASGTNARQARPVDPHVSIDRSERDGSPVLEFPVEFRTTGPHYIWVRGRSVSGRRGETNSVHVGIEGAETSGVKSLSFRPESGYLWSNQLQGSSGRARIRVDSEGRGTVRVWMRENGFVLDRLVLTADPNWAPGPEGPSVEMWETKTWTVENGSYKGNPYDVISTVTFRHTRSSRTRTTEMYYGGNDEWKFRFTGARTGRWTYESKSEDPELDGVRGSVRVVATESGPDRGFLTSKGNEFAVQTDDAGELEPFLYNVYQISSKVRVHKWTTSKDPSGYLDEAKANGCRLIFIAVYNSWFEYGTEAYTEHGSRNPDRKTFRVLEHLIREAHDRGMAIHFWAWGDEYRKWTPIGVGGQNGKPDRRLQRYIAARLGPLPGWTMGYGFDLEEWATEKEVGTWAQYMHDHLGWSHLLMARGRRHQNLDVVSYSDLGHSYQDAVSNLSSDGDRPHFFEERDLYQRESYHTMQWTRRHLWRYTIAGGHGGFWGISWDTNGTPYPKPEQLRTFQEFWQGRDRFRFPMERKNNLSPDGRVLAAPSDDQYVVYAEDARNVQVDLSGLSSRVSAVAVDTEKSYSEERLGKVGSGSKTFQLPRESDWAIAVGAFP